MRKLVAKVAALTLAVAGTLATAGPAAADGNRSEHERQGTTVLVHSDGATVTLSRSRVDEGRIAFQVDTSNNEGGSQITLFRLVGDATLATIVADLGDARTAVPQRMRHPATARHRPPRAPECLRRLLRALPVSPRRW